MLSCKYCDYYSEMKSKSGTGKENMSVCEFTDFMFNEDVEALDMEYPCKDMTYQGYLDSISQSINEKATA